MKFSQKTVFNVVIALLITDFLIRPLVNQLLGGGNLFGGGGNNQ